MPIVMERIERGIYCGHWIGDIITDDLLKAADETEAMAHADQLESYITLIDGSKVGRIPIHLNTYMKSIRSGMPVLLVLNAPLAGELMIRMINRLMPYQVEHFKDREAWLKRARELSGPLLETTPDV